MSAARYVVQSIKAYPATETKPAWSHTGYWYGPDHGWGTTWGALDDPATRRFSSRAAAENALRKVYGEPIARLRRAGYTVMSTLAVS